MTLIVQHFHIYGDLEKKCAQSRPTPKCSLHAKGHRNRSIRKKRFKMMIFVQRFHVFWDFWKKYAESRPRPICSSYAKGYQNRSSSLAAYPVKNGSKWRFPCSVATFFCVFPNIDVLQPSQDQNVISCQKAPKSVSKWPRYLTKTAKNDVFRAAFPHFLRFLKKNTPSHVWDQYVVRMQKGIKIGPVVLPLTR